RCGSWLAFVGFCFHSLRSRPPTSTLFPYTTLFRSHIGGSNCGGQSYHLKVSLGDPSQTFQCNSKLTPTLVFGKFVYLVDYHETDVSQVPTEYPTRKNRLKSLWSRDEQIRWASGLAGSLLDLRISMPDPDLEVDLL